MDTVNLRAIINHCLEHEHRTSELAWMLRRRLQCLHINIHITASNPVVFLLDFVQRYAQRLPDILDATGEIARLQGIDDVAEAIIDRCVEFFARPPPLLAGHNGLNGAMNTAYMAHRLMEEMNDYLLLTDGRVLVPLDTARSNLVVHQLIGEGFANQLDEAVRLIVSDLIGQFSEQTGTGQALRSGQIHALPQLTEMLARWPCLKDTLGGDLLRLGAFPAPAVH